MLDHRSIQLIVGLGNVGTSYAMTRHNFGFHFVDQLATHYTATWSLEKKFSAFITKVCIEQRAITLLKPTTLMNNSGLAVNAMLRFRPIEIDNILVVHDELDLTPGQIRWKFGGSSAGHRGVQSIIDHLNNNAFWRLRIGIGHPRDQEKNKQESVSSYVLKTPSMDENIAIERALLQGLNIFSKK